MLLSRSCPAAHGDSIACAYAVFIRFGSTLNLSAFAWASAILERRAGAECDERPGAGGMVGVPGPRCVGPAVLPVARTAARPVAESGADAFRAGSRRSARETPDRRPARL